MPQQAQQRRWRRNCPPCFVWLVLAVTVVLPSCGPSEATHTHEVRQIPVSSKAMRSVGYDESQKVLTVEFPNGSVYEYQGVPAEIHSGLMRAQSHGQYFQRHVRNAGYTTNRIR